MKKTKPQMSHNNGYTDFIKLGRTSKSHIKLIFSICVIICSLLKIRNNKQNEEEIRKLFTSNTKHKIEEWMKRMKNTNETNVEQNNAAEDFTLENDRVRFFDNCAVDKVSFMLNQEELSDELANVLGVSKVYFGEESWCHQNLNIASVEGTWTAHGLQGRTNITFTDQRYSVGTFKDGSIVGILTTHRCIYGSCDIWEEEEKVDVTYAGHLESLLR